MVLYVALMLHPNSSWSTSVFDTFTCLSLTLDGTLLPNVLLGRRRRGSRQRAGRRVRVWDQLYESRISSGRGVTAEHLATFHVCAPLCGRGNEGGSEGGLTVDGRNGRLLDRLSVLRPSVSPPLPRHATNP